MRQHVVVLQDPISWRRLVAEYAALRQPGSGLTRQARGQRFNGMIAELLTTFGLRAKSDQRSVGELDVVFNHAGRRYILEAKWEQAKTGTGPIAKLQRRVEQRMAGATGVFLAIKGFTDEAIDEIDKGRRRTRQPILEREATAFGSHFLAPSSPLRDELPARLDFDQLQHVKRRWCPSLKALIYRGHAMGIYKDYTYRRAINMLTEWGYPEPGDLGVLPREVRDTAGWWVTAECGVSAVVIVGVEPGG